MKNCISVLSFTLFLLTTIAFGQPFNKEKKSLVIQAAQNSIKVDGVLNEKDWESAAVARDFYQRFPSDTSLSLAQTEVRLTYDKQFLYIGAICYRPDSGKYVVQSLRRDYNTRGVDHFAVLLDPFQDQTNGFQFVVNAYGVQREALVVNGGNGREGTSISWDNKWFVKVSRLPDHWVVEMAIPFNTLRFKEGSRQWGINFGRYDSQTNERTNWTWIPRNFQSTSLAYTSELNWDNPLKKTGKNLSVIPYLAGDYVDDFEDDQEASPGGDVGGDIKVGLTSSLNLDLTINPDFSQVEVDRQVTNLDRFEISFPERRQFFLENEDLFSNFGSQSLRPFFTRRIGIATDTTTGLTVENKILAGARLSGKLNKDWRVGLLDMQTSADEALGIHSANYMVGVVQRQVLKRSNFSAIFVNKQNMVPDNPEDTLDRSDYSNRVIGLDYNHASADNRLQGKVFYHRSLDNISDDAFAHGVNMKYNTATWEIAWEHEWVGEGYQADVGFIRRTGYKRITPAAEVKFYPKSRIFNRVGFEVQSDMFWSNENGLTDRTVSFDYIMRFNTGDYLRIGYENDFVKLTSDFDPTRLDGPELSAGTSYLTHRLRAFYFSDQRRPVAAFLRGTMGGYYNGWRAGISGELNFRLQPYFVLSTNLSVNRIVLPEPYKTANLLLLGPKFDFTFSKQLFLSTLVQYNNQINNLNINARFQWRFAPVSDLFIVYTDNYYADHLGVKNRGIILKLTYWLNV